MKNIASFPAARGTNPLTGIRAAAMRSMQQIALADLEHDDVHDLFPTTVLAGTQAPRSGKVLAWFHLGLLLGACATLLLAMNGCGGGYPGLGLTSVTTSAAVLDSGQSVILSAGQSGDLPVTWTITGANCAEDGCGSIESTGNSTGVYKSPTGVTSPMMVTITASVPGTGMSRNTAVTVNPDPTITGTLPAGTVGAAYTGTLQTSGGTGTLTLSVVSGTLPPGLTLDTSTGIVSGNPTAVGTYSFVAQVTDAAPTPMITQTTESITIVVPGAALTLLSGNPPNGTVGIPYSYGLVAAGGTTPYTFTRIGGSLPGGLALSSAGTVSGTPTAAGTSTFTAQVQDGIGNTATGSFTITVSPSGSLTLGSLANGTVGVAYSSTLGVTGGTAPYKCTVASGTLPAGLALSAGCVVSGTPTAAGTTSLTVTATDSSNPVLTTTGPVSLTISPAGLSLSTGSLPAGTVGTPYSSTIGVAGGTSPYSCVILSGALPAGLTLGANCQVTGTPTTAGTATLTVKATDGGTPAQTATGQVTLTINPAALSLTSGGLPNGTVGTPYSSIIGVTGGTSPYSCVITTGALPAGLTLGANCQVTGTPTTAGTATLTVKATDGGTPAQTATGQVTLTINPAALSLTSGGLPNGTVGTPYSSTIGVTGGTSPYSCVITSGTLPAGLTLGPNCLVSGTPTVAASATLMVQATDSSSPAQSAGGQVTITIHAAPTLTITGPAAGTAGTPYTGTIGVTGGSAPYTCTLQSGTLQTGLTLNSNCTVTGTPTSSGTSTISVAASDSSTPARTTTGSVAITINPATTTLTLGNPAPATAGAPYNGTVPVTGGTGPYTCSLANGSALPAGLSFGPGCTLTGTPTTPGTTTAQVTVVDSASPVDTTTGPVSITVQTPAALTFTGSLPNAILNQPYSQTLAASGGIGPYTYAVTTGALPAGLTLNATTGVVSGTPTAPGASSFTVTATDSESTPQTAPLPLVLMVVYAPSPNDTLLQGPYAFLFQGYDSAVVGALAYQTATVGSFTADGNGVLTAGELDGNHQTSNPTGATISTDMLMGTYTIGSDDRGTMVISTFNADGTVAGSTTFAIDVKAPVSPATTSARGSMTKSDNSVLFGSRGTATFLQQTATAFTTGLTGSYAFGFQGETPCLPACTANLQAGPVATVGQMTLATGTLTGETDTNLSATNYPAAPLSGTYGTADTYGRVQLSLTNPNIPYASYPVDFVVYMVNGNQAFVMSSDKHSAYILLAGNMSSQTATSFGNASLSGPYVGYENAPTNPGLVGSTLQNVANLSVATIFQGTANSTGSCTTNYVDQGGTTALVNGLTGLGSGFDVLNYLLGTYASTGTSACTVGTNGRAILNYPVPVAVPLPLQLLGITATPPAPRVAYLTNTNTGYFLETGYAGLGNLEQQMGEPFSLATLNGTYAYGTTPAVTAVTLNASGTLTADGAGNASYLLDESVSAGNLNAVTLGVSGSGTYVLTDANNGRFTFGTDVLFAITPTRFVLVDKSATDTSPSVALIY